MRTLKADCGIIEMDKEHLHLGNREQNVEDIELRASQISEWMGKNYFNEHFPMYISNNRSRVAYAKYVASSKLTAELISATREGVLCGKILFTFNKSLHGMTEQVNSSKFEFDRKNVKNFVISEMEKSVMRIREEFGSVSLDEKEYINDFHPVPADTNRILSLHEGLS